MTEEEIKYHNRLWYYKTYNQLIDKCLQMEKDGYPEDMYTEVHHILPKCQGGTNDKNNLVRMPVRYHIIAHILLSFAFPDNVRLAIAAHCITSVGNKYTKDFRTFSINKISTRLLAEIKVHSIEAKKKMFSKENNPNWGKKTSDETKKKQSLAKKGKYDGKNHPNYGKHWPEEMRNRISKTLKEKGICSGGNNPAAKKVIGPDGTIYDCLTDAGKDYGVTRKTISRWIKNHPEKGFKFYTEKDNN